MGDANLDREPMRGAAGDCAHGVPGDLKCGACEQIMPELNIGRADLHAALAMHGLIGPGVVENLVISPAGIEATLSERGNRYGSFTESARITQNLKAAMIDSPNWSKLADDQREALEMVQHKIGRILNGDPNYHDSWHDIVGYAKLVADRLEAK